MTTKVDLCRSCGQQLAQNEEVIETLRQEMESLQTRLNIQENIDNQLEVEISLEKFDERRINQLKAQVYQMERQIVLLNNALGDYQEKIVTAEGVLLESSEVIRNLLQEYKSGKNIVAPYQAFQKLSAKLEALSKNLNNAQKHYSSERATPLMTSRSKFLKRDTQPSISDVCSGNLQHLNLQRVGVLEHSLSSLYGELVKLLLILNDSGSPRSSADLRKYVKDAVLKLQQGCVDLTALSLLVATAPWKTYKALPDVTVDGIMAALPKLTSCKQQEMRNLFTGVLKLCDSKYRLNMQKIKSYEEELKFHRQVYDIQKQYTEELMTSVKEQHQNYEAQLQASLVEPLSGVLTSYHTMVDNPDETSLKLFLKEFKTVSHQISNACEQVLNSGVRRSQLDQCVTNFQKQLHECENRAQQKRKQMLAESMMLEDAVRDLSPLNITANKLPTKKLTPKKITSVPRVDPRNPTKAFQSSFTSQDSATSFLNRIESLDSTKSSLSTPETMESDCAGSARPEWLTDMETKLSQKISSLSPDKEITTANISESEVARDSNKRRSRHAKPVNGVPMSTLQLLPR